MTATIRDVAERAGVSIATVSRVMNDHPDVGTETRERVRSVAGELGYTVNGAARALATSRSQLIALVTGDGAGRRELAFTFFGDVIDSVTRHLDEHGYDAILLHDDPRRGHAYALRAARHGAEGLMIMGTTDPDRIAAAPPALPCLGVEARCEGPNHGCVSFDHADGLGLCVRHLYALGHRQLAFLAGPTTVPSAISRRIAFLDETAKLGLAISPEHIREGDFSPETAYRETCALLAGTLPPTAIVAVSDMVAIAAMQAIRDFGLEPGRDVAVTGYDDLPIASLAYPPLTTIRQDRERLGEVAVSLLLELIENPGGPAPEVVLPVTLVVRASTGARHP
jgi:LacI family transcriptional regulator